jgi:N-acetylneuraminate synthase
MTPWEWTADLVAEANCHNLVWLSTPFDASAVDFLEQFEPPAYKIASFELVDLPLIRYVASKRRPVIMSTGMATLEEIDDAVVAATSAGAHEVALLRCNSGYPAQPSEMDLRSIPVMADRWHVPIGLSDHTRSNAAAVAAVALGATIIEKHLTLRRSDGGPDAEFSLEPDEFAELVIDVRDAHAALGTIRFGPSPREESSVRFRRSLRACRDIAAGDTLDATNVRSMRPAGGLSPDSLDKLRGRQARRDISTGSPIRWSDVTGNIYE